MPTRNVNLTDELDRFVLKKVESRRYENASEVVRRAADFGAGGTAIRGEACCAARRPLMKAMPAALLRAT
jgi:hypothetical protein